MCPSFSILALVEVVQESLPYVRSVLESSPLSDEVSVASVVSSDARENLALDFLRLLSPSSVQSAPGSRLLVDWDLGCITLFVMSRKRSDESEAVIRHGEKDIS